MVEPFSAAIGLVTIAAFMFSLYQHLSNRAKGMLEEAKVKAQHQRIRGATYAAVAAAESANAIVQRSKQPSSTEEELRNLARVVRGQLAILVRQLELEDETLSSWRFGRMTDSPPRSNGGCRRGSKMKKSISQMSIDQGQR